MLSTIASSGSSPTYNWTISNEMVQFYVHLSVAGLLGSLNPTGTTYTLRQDWPANTASQMQDTGMTIFYYPGGDTANTASTVKPGHYLWLSHYGLYNSINSNFVRSNGAVNWLSQTLLDIDTKIDDGKPITGRLTTPQGIIALWGTGTGTRPNISGSGSWSYNGLWANAASNVYLSTGSSSYTYPYGTMDPGNCYAFYQILQ